MVNKQVSVLLQLFENERNQARAQSIERIIPQQSRAIEECKKLGLPYVADLRILEGMKREYRALTGRDYQ